MLSESVDSTEIEPNDRSQPQISAIFPHLGTRFSQVEWAFHKNWTPACASVQNQICCPPSPGIRISNNIRFRQRKLGGVASKKFETPWQATRPLIALRQAAATQISMANRIKRRCSSALFHASRPTSLISPSRQAMPRKLHAPKRRSRRAGRDFRPSAGRRPAPPHAPP